MANAREIAEAVAAAIELEGWSRVVLLGYSYGALLAFETARVLDDTGATPVTVLVTCARAAPQSTPSETVADWSDKKLMDYVRDLGGLPPEIEAEPAFLDLLLPVMRADFRANDLYAADPGSRIGIPIVTIAGSDDPATTDGHTGAWSERTRARHQIFNVKGGHFFVLENPASTFQAIRHAASSRDLVS